MRIRRLKPAAFLWDESFLWGLMAYKALRSNNLHFELLRAEDVKKGKLKNYKMLFVPGGWASNKLKSLGDEGISEIKKFIRSGGNYLGFCGGAGLATLDGIGLLKIKRMPTKHRVPSFSGRIHLNVTEHPIWKNLINLSLHNSITTLLNCYPRNRLKAEIGDPFWGTPIFHAWWPSQFLVDNNDIEILATYGNALPDSFSSDLNVGDIERNGGWTELEKIYGINLDPKRLINEPAVVEGVYGKGKVLLSLIHFDTPGDANGAIILKNLWEYLTGQSTNLQHLHPKKSDDFWVIPHLQPSVPLHSFTHSSIIDKLESAVDELIDLGIRNFLWFWRNPMLLQWRRGVRGLEYCTLYIMIKEIAEIIKNGQESGSPKNRNIFGGNSIEDNLNGIKELLVPFIDKARHLLILERYAMQNGHITYEKCDNPEIQKIRTELFSNSKSHGGLFKKLIDKIDNLLYSLIKTVERDFTRGTLSPLCPRRRHNDTA